MTQTPITDMVRDKTGDYLAAVEELEQSHAELLVAMVALLAFEDEANGTCLWCGDIKWLRHPNGGPCVVDNCPGVMARAAIASGKYTLATIIGAHEPGCQCPRANCTLARLTPIDDPEIHEALKDVGF